MKFLEREFRLLSHFQKRDSLCSLASVLKKKKKKKSPDCPFKSCNFFCLKETLLGSMSLAEVSNNQLVVDKLVVFADSRHSCLWFRNYLIIRLVLGRVYHSLERESKGTLHQVVYGYF